MPVSDHTSGSGTETAPTGAISVIIELVGAGAGGAVSTGALGGGGAGGTYILWPSIPVNAGDTCPYVCGAPGAGKAAGSAGSGTSATASTINSGGTATGGFAVLPTNISTLAATNGTITTGGNAQIPTGTGASILRSGNNGTTGTGGKGGNGAIPLGAVGGANAPGVNQAGTNGGSPGAGGGCGETVQKGGDGGNTLIRYTYILGLAPKPRFTRQAVNRAARF